MSTSYYQNLFSEETPNFKYEWEKPIWSRSNYLILDSEVKSPQFGINSEKTLLDIHKLRQPEPRPELPKFDYECPPPPPRPRSLYCRGNYVGTVDRFGNVADTLGFDTGLRADVLNNIRGPLGNFVGVIDPIGQIQPPPTISIPVHHGY